MLPLGELAHSAEKFRAISRAQLCFRKQYRVRAGEDRCGEHEASATLSFLRFKGCSVCQRSQPAGSDATAQRQAEVTETKGLNMVELVGIEKLGTLKTNKLLIRRESYNAQKASKHLQCRIDCTFIVRRL
jgi:hypothetical protein